MGALDYRGSWTYSDFHFRAGEYAGKQIAGAQFLHVYKPRRWINCGQAGPLGWTTPAALGVRVADQAGVLAKVTGILANAGISIDAVLQREADEVGGEGSTQTDLIILTHDTREGTMNDAIAQMQQLPTVLAPITRIRKEELN